MDAKKIVECIGNGFQSAFNTANNLISIDESETKVVEVRPEYLATVEIAKALRDQTEHSTYMEMPFHLVAKKIIGHSNWDNLFSSLTSEEQEEVNILLKEFAEDHEFEGRDKSKKPLKAKDDTRRLDVFVENDKAPDNKANLVFIEIKLNNNFKGILKDIEKVSGIINLYNRLQGISAKKDIHFNHSMYAAVSFYFSFKGHSENVVGDANDEISELIQKTKNKAETIFANTEGINIKVGCIENNSQIVEPIVEDYDGSGFDIVRPTFTFVPMIILISNEDINDVDDLLFSEVK